MPGTGGPNTMAKQISNKNESNLVHKSKYYNATKHYSNDDGIVFGAMLVWCEDNKVYSSVEYSHWVAGGYSTVMMQLLYFEWSGLPIGESIASSIKVGLFFES